MTSNEVQKAVRAEPFRPFRVHMGGGRALDVPHRECITISPNNRIAVVFDQDGAPEVVDIFTIQSIQFLPDRRTGRGRKQAG